MSYSPVADSVLAVDKPVRSLDIKQIRDNARDHRHGQSDVATLFEGEITPTQLTANANDYNPTGWSTAAVARISSDKAVSITGLQQGSQGQVKVLMNVGNFTISLIEESSSSSAANRFGQGFLLKAGKMVVLVYDGTAQRWRTEGFGAVVNTGDIPRCILKLGAINLAQNATTYMRYLGGTADGTEANVQIAVLFPFKLKELRAYAAAAVPAGQTVTFTVRKNQADTALTCQITEGQQLASNTADEIFFGVGDEFSLKVVSSSSAGTNDYSATILAMLPDDRDIGLPLANSFMKGNIISGGNMWGEFGGTQEAGAGANNYGCPLPRCFSTWIQKLDGAGTGIDLRRNASDSVVYDSDVRGGLESYFRLLEYPVEWSDGDRLSFRAAAGSVNTLAVLLKSANEDKYDPTVMAFTRSGHAQGTTGYMGGFVWGGSTTEGECTIQMPSCRIKNLRGVIDTTLSLGETVTCTVRKNGVDTAMTLTFTNAGDVTASDLTNEVTFAAGDTMSISMTSSSGAGTRAVTVSVEPFAS